MVADALHTVTIVALDLGYLRTGYAVVRQPGDQVLKYGIIKAEPYRAKVTELVRVKRAKSACDGCGWRCVTPTKIMGR